MVGPLIYIVDDDADFLEEMIFGLSVFGMDAHGFHNASTLYRAYASKPPDVLVLDIVLEGEDGISIAAHLRNSQSVGIIMATARGSTEDRINGLRNGADAYLTKPIDARELAATVVAVNERIKRSPRFSNPVSPKWALIEGGWVLTDNIGHRLRLTISEQRILTRLFRERGKIIERTELIEAIGSDIHDFNYSHLDTIMSRLRQRAGKANMLLPLHAIRGRGFTFTD